MIEDDPHVQAAMEHFALIVSAGATGDFEALSNDEHAAWESIVAELTAALTRTPDPQPARFGSVL